MSSKLRRTSGGSDKPAPSGGTAYLMILHAIDTRTGLINGTLERDGEFCAIGSFFHVNNHLALPSAMIDEVAMVNDSMPLATARQRKTRVRQWLRWRLAECGMPGFANAKRPKAN